MSRERHSLSNLTRRERQIMEIIYARGSAEALEVQALLPDRPSYSAVRAALSLLEKKKRLRHSRRGARYIFEPTVPADTARVPALKRLLETFFDNSAVNAVATLLDSKELEVTDDELDRLEKMIKAAKKERK